MNALSHTRHVLLLETDERAGLVASLAAVCAARNVSLEITTGPGHVLITFATDPNTLAVVAVDLKQVPGVQNVQSYTVA